MDASAHFRGKKITLMRVGLLGRGVGDARYLAECGADVLVVDNAAQEVMQPSVDALNAFPNIRFKFGPYDLDDFRHCDLVVKGAGTPLDSPEIAEAHKNGIPVRMSADLFIEYAGIPCIGVTGTRGKSTVTHMIADALEKAGRKVLLGGNIRGVSTLALLPEATPEHVAVLELDSWQCQGLGEAKLSPHVAVFTTFYPDHLNYYKGDLDAYLADKANIFLYQKPGDTFVLSSQAKPFLEKKYSAHVARAVEADMSQIAGWKLRVPGNHNLQNAASARAALRALGLEDAAIRNALESFVGVPGRLELVREVNGIRIYNDTNSTTPEATLAALAALDPAKTVLVMGGADKGLDMSALLTKLQEVKKVVLLSGSGTERIQNAIPGAPVYQSLKEAATAALAAAEQNDALLFSPGFASFGMFKNEYDRGDQFLAFASAIPDLSALKPKVRSLAGKLVAESKKQGIELIISRGFRTLEEQEAYYAQGRTKPGGIITNARAGESFHNYGVAFDVRPVAKSAEERETLYKKVGPIGERLGLEWGGGWKDFVDLPHFQFTGGYTIEDFKRNAADEKAFAL